MRSPSLTLLAAALASALAVTSVHAQSTIEFVNSSHPPIQLRANTDVTFDSEGNLEAECVLQAAPSTLCAGLGTTVGPRPQVTLSAPAAVTTAVAFNVTRTIVNTADVCLTALTPAQNVVGWGSVTPSNGTTEVRINAAGTYEFGLRCYNIDGANQQLATATVVAEGPTNTWPPDPSACTLPSSPAIRPAGFVEYVRTWEVAFFGQSYPNTPSFLAPIGSFTISKPLNNGPSSVGMYLSIPFIPNAAQSITLRHNPAQTVQTTEGTYGGRPGSFLVGISPCAGDLRPPSTAAEADIWQRHCRFVGTEANMSFGTLAGNQCRLVEGQVYWLTYSATDPYNLSPNTNTCEGGSVRCEVNVRR
jgi:hypothetical protein